MLRKTNKPYLVYFYPLWHQVSFTYVAKQHCRYLRQWFNLVEIDELAYYNRDIYAKYITVVHPYFFMATRDPKWTFKLAQKAKALIGIDVADTDRLGSIAVHLANLTHGMIVPSTFSREAYIRSGVKVPVYVVPHGLEETYYSDNVVPKHPFIVKLREEKKKNNYIYVLYILIHSGFRKGAPWVYAVMREILRDFPNVKLVIKFGALAGHDFMLLSQLTNMYFSAHLSVNDMVALYDTCDIYLLFSIGGGFEICGLEALARGEVVLASNKGSWTDYLPQFCLIEHDNPVQVFPDQDPISGIHCGYGYPVKVDKAIEKLKDVIENLEEYKAKVREYWNKIKHEWTWSSVCEKLKEILLKYA